MVWRFVMWRFRQMHWRGVVFYVIFPAACAVGSAVVLLRGDIGQACVGLALLLLLGLSFAWPALRDLRRTTRGEVSEGAHARQQPPWDA